MAIPPKKIVNVELSNATQFGLVPILKTGEVDEHYQWLSFDVTKGIEGHEVGSASIEIYIEEEPITNFSITKIGISDADGSREFITVPLNKAFVTKVSIRFYCESNYVYRIEVPLSAL